MHVIDVIINEKRIPIDIGLYIVCLSINSILFLFFSFSFSMFFAVFFLASLLLTDIGKKVQSVLFLENIFVPEKLSSLTVFFLVLFDLVGGFLQLQTEKKHF